jgi:dTDP-4-dehydrorhamnose reductase
MGKIMRILIIGAEGMLGHDLVDVLSKGNEIITTTIDTLDITDIKKAIHTVNDHQPDVVVHAAAYTDVDGSESNQDLAYKVNSLGTRNVALACRRIDCSMVYISTDYVFDGTKGASYYEYDQTNPINVYGLTKLLGEKYVKEQLNKFYIIRTSWLYGFHGDNFVKTMLNLSQSNDTINVVDDQIGSPTYTWDLSTAISQLIESPVFGTYHITNSKNCSWYQFAQEIFRQKKIDITLNPVTTENFPRPAKRPKHSVLNNYNWKMEGFHKIRSYKKALKDYLSL